MSSTSPPPRSAIICVGGVLSAGPDRLGAIARTGIPYVGSAGALDMVNFWAMDTVPAQFRSRNLYRHNPQVTLLRTSPEECRQIGEWIGEKLNACPGPVRFLIPEKGVSAIDAPGQPFYDPARRRRAVRRAREHRAADQRSASSCAFRLHINDARVRGRPGASSFREIAA